MQEMQGDASLIPGSGRSPGGGNGNLLQYSHLKNLMDRGAWRVTVHRVTKSQIWLTERTCMHAHTRDPRELPSPSTVWAHSSTTAISKPESRSPAGTQSASALILGFPESRPVKNKVLLFISHLGYDNLLKQPELTKTLSKTTIFSHKSILTGSFSTSQLHSNFTRLIF